MSGQKAGNLCGEPKPFCSTVELKEKELSKAIWIREDDKRQNILLLSFCLQTPCLPATALQEKSKVPPEITWVAGLHNCLRSCFLLKGYLYCEYGDKESWWSGTNRWQHVLIQKKWGNNALYHQSLCPHIFQWLEDIWFHLYLMWFTFAYTHEINL